MIWLIGLLIVVCAGLLLWCLNLQDKFLWAVKGWDRAAGYLQDSRNRSSELRNDLVELQQDLAAMTQQRDDYRKRWLEARNCED